MNDTLNRQICCFEIHGELMGIDVSFISEIIRNQLITSVPKSEPYISGLINLRGNILTAIDLDEIINISTDQNQMCEAYEMMIILSNGLSELALRVNAVLDIIPFNENELEKMNIDPTLEKSNYFDGVFRFENKNILILDTKKILELVQ